MFNLCIFRQESIKQAERERRMKYRKQDEEREVIRSAIREKVIQINIDFQKRSIESILNFVNSSTNFLKALHQQF